MHDETRDRNAESGTSTKSGAYSTPTSTRSCHRPSKRPGKAESRWRSCIELWFVLHSRDQAAHIHRHDVQSLSNKLGFTDDKKIADAARATLVVGFETAKQRARALDARHAGNGSPRRSNPSTDVWRLVDRLNSDP